MGSNHLYPMAVRIFRELCRCLFWNGSRLLSYLSASKGCSKFCVTKLCLYSLSFQATFKQLSSTAVLPFNEPVEAMDYDSGKCKLVLTSHTGKIKLFHIEKNGTKTPPCELSCRDINIVQEPSYQCGRKIGMRPMRENASFLDPYILPRMEKVSQFSVWSLEYCK